MRKRILALLALTLFAALDCNAAPLQVGKETLTKDTVWSGEVEVTGDVYVPPGVTLTVAPGTIVKFNRIDAQSDRNLFGGKVPYYAQAELIVRGKLVARGTAEKMIVFTSAEKEPQPADWGALNFLGSSGNVLDYCRVLYAYNGIHSHGAQVEVQHSELAKNAVAISIRKEDEVQGVPWWGQESDLTVKGSSIHDNKGGINFRASRVAITGNSIKDNKFFGLWAKEKSLGEVSGNEITGNYKGIYIYRSEGTRIHHNNIYKNSEYDMAIADEQESDVAAAQNWFGSTDRTEIAAHLYDKESDPTVARIVFEPFLKEPVQVSGR
ncbi:right-handed parallel beta-helix repeat-containing protein [Geomonas sp. RF6]|uniref:right-handed parallel beta-helix repeat-containing protein n=1 Tax=Geomonas sp. RF6 TaxID=2897342 RepID=UPI001E335C1F|nr:right-handed parallel beta-helix repeat-containing protein [Geomonas sp. RF6]UFS70315.1 right-handed parallel beta-helix repeat-containing protein [Geomonas sp. RF6]